MFVQNYGKIEAISFRLSFNVFLRKHFVGIFFIYIIYYSDLSKLFLYCCDEEDLAIVYQIRTVR